MSISQYLRRQGTHPGAENFHIYCDESSTRDNQYMVIGGIWCPWSLEATLRAELARVKTRCRLGEVKWGKVTERYLPHYQDFASVLFHYPQVCANFIIIDKRLVDYRTYHNNDRELAFYKFYFLLVSRNILPTYRYWLYVDQRPDRQDERLSELRDVINNYHNRENGQRPIRHAEPRISKNDDLIQLADLYVGAVQAAWNGVITRQAKLDLCAFMAQQAKLASLSTATFRGARPINIWYWRPNGRCPR